MLLMSIKFTCDSMAWHLTNGSQQVSVAVGPIKQAASILENPSDNNLIHGHNTMLHELDRPRWRSDIGVKQGCPLSPTLFGLYIDELEEWLNSQEGDGALLGDFVTRLLLYADDLIPIAKSALGLQEHLISLECFCSTVGMQVNTSKTKVAIFSSKRKHKQHKFYFEGNTLEEVTDYNTSELTSTKI
jgi:hypothetical protein